MASRACLLLFAALLSAAAAALAGAPHFTSEYSDPELDATVDANFFKFTGLINRTLWGKLPANGASFKATTANQQVFPALAGQSVSCALLQFAPGGINPPHIHPQSSELLIVLHGTLTVGFVDSTGKLFTQQLKPCEVFLFPEGLVHFQANLSPRVYGVALSAFGSSNAETISLPKAIFGSGIDEQVLAESFNTDAATIGKLASANAC
ncbi:Germin-like protein 9-3 [Apostasia shenzhenica]|uniref:Germin-like protein n=1 Tax=Apostasia shenzhenica TaxID=1088818 RepID=A0A2I0B5G0_9ASPA|nr:Germin-like protein 9-3 [Apostasia shenzhenica]